MAWGLPKLPGLQFSDPTKTQFQLCGSLKFHQGHRMPDTKVRGPGNSATDVDSNAFALTDDSCNYDPSLTYGRVKQPALPQVIPHFVSYDKRCLNFTAFFKQPVYDSADEKFRVRLVNIIYFLEDDSMTVMEPHVRNSGIWQGRLVKRGKIPKNDLGEFWHWKDLDVGKDICIYGRVFHTCTCDLYTKEYLQSQGIELSKEEQLPRDPYTEREFWKDKPIPKKPKSKQDTLRQFLEYDGKILSFDVVWDNRDMPHGELGKYKLLYFLQDDTISVKELHDDRGGKDPFPLLLKKMKLPKKWMQKPVTFPSIVLETTEEEVTTYYVPKDLLIGETVFVLGRRFLIYDCDGFTRHYYKTMLGMDQPPRLDIPKRPEKEFPKKFPPHIGIGAPEDSLQSCFGLIPKPPYKDIIRYNLNANKYLRYLCELEPIHPEDFGRKFIFLFSLADSKIKIQELARRNSGRREGRFLAAMKLQLPDSDPSFPTYYTPDKFYIGAVIPVFKHRFKIIGCDLFVYRYMSSNPDKFPPQVIENVRNYHMREGNLKDELEAAARDEQAADTRAQLAKIGQQAIAEPSAMEKCLMALDVVEGSEMPLSQPTPPPTTDRISYDEYLHEARLSKPVCEGVLPLKGILKSGALPKDDQHKVVCFSGPETGDYRDSAKPMPSFYPSGQQPLFDDDPNFCDRYKEPNADIREELRARNICQYEISPKVEALGDSRGEPDLDKKAQQIPGYLGSFDVDCKEVPDYMRLPPDAYEKVKKIRKDVPDISPAAVRVGTYPREPPPAVDSCVHPPPEETGPCAPRKEEDVSFACPHVQPILPCCPEDKQDNKNNETENTKL